MSEIKYQVILPPGSTSPMWRNIDTEATSQEISVSNSSADQASTKLLLPDSYPVGTVVTVDGGRVRSVRRPRPAE